MHIADERQAPSARVFLLRLASSAPAASSHDSPSLRQAVLAVHRSTGWTPVDPASPPAVNKFEFDPACYWEEALSLLNEPESHRASELRDVGVRQAYVYAHAALRLLLARELGGSESAIRFTAGAFGKPWLAEPRAQLHFNLARRPGVVALALGTAPIGVDVEAVRGGIDIPGISQRFFTEAEQTFIASGVGEVESVSRFFGLWSRKEALLKAAGVGIDALQAADALKPTAALADEWGTCRTYCVHQLPSAAGYSLAMAVELPSFAA